MCSSNALEFWRRHSAVVWDATRCPSTVEVCVWAPVSDAFIRVFSPASPPPPVRSSNVSSLAIPGCTRIAHWTASHSSSGVLCLPWAVRAVAPVLLHRYGPPGGMCGQLSPPAPGGWGLWCGADAHLHRPFLRRARCARGAIAAPWRAPAWPMLSPKPHPVVFLPVCLSRFGGACCCWGACRDVGCCCGIGRWWRAMVHFVWWCLTSDQAMGCTQRWCAGGCESGRGRSYVVWHPFWSPAVLRWTVSRTGVSLVPCCAAPVWPGVWGGGLGRQSPGARHSCTWDFYRPSRAHTLSRKDYCSPTVTRSPLLATRGHCHVGARCDEVQNGRCGSGVPLESLHRWMGGWVGGSIGRPRVVPPQAARVSTAGREQYPGHGVGVEGFIRHV